MSIHFVFAANLRRKCAEFGTIADVCRGIGINRQQFNKYLAGKSIPNAITLRNICTFLNVQEQALFANEAGAPTSTGTSTNTSMPGFIGFPQLKKKNFDFYVADLPCGFYNCFFPLQNVPGMLVRSLVYVTLNGRQKEFARLTRLHSAATSKKPLVVGRHSGIICANKSEIYLLGVNRHSPYQLTMMAIERTTGPCNGFYKGLILTHNFNALINPKMCMLYADDQNNPRLLIKSLGVLHESDPALDSLVVSTLHS
jgi:transcriptional regulator with XRE-family HTH domain